MKLAKISIGIGVIIFLLFSAGKIMAEMKPDSLTLTPFFGGYIFEGDQNLKHGATYGLGLGYNFDNHWGAEAAFSFIDTEFEAGTGDVKGFQYRLDSLYHFAPYEKFLLYLAAGIGGITLDFERGGSDTDPLVNYGVGVKYFFNDTMALRGDIRHVMSFDDMHHNVAYTLGLTFYFGGEKKKIVQLPIDSDGDGVYDYLDQCPDTPTGVKVDDKGCPLDSDGDGVPDYLDQCPDTPRAAKADEKGCPLDSDGDGVYDYLDQCPDTPTGVKVDDKGCPLDSDGDGVPDYLDQCPRTPKGATVNEVGCWVCKGLEFDFDKWNIKPQYYPILDEAVDCMNQHPYIKVQIQGHTDNIGTEEYNQVLSEKRAREVMNYFIKKGIAKERLSVIGYGFSKPIASNETPEGRAMNRRVQLKPIY